MELGISIPDGVADKDPSVMIDWGRRAEARGFSTLGVIGRLAVPTHEELETLAALAEATERIRLMPNLLVAPEHEPVLFAKQAAMLDRASNGRLVLGLGVGMRADDFVASEFEDHGNRFDDMLETMHAVWKSDEQPPVNGQVPIYFGTLADAPRVAKRIAKWGDGYISVGPPPMVEGIIAAINEAWTEEGREGRIRLAAANYFAFGDDAIAEGERNIRAYYDGFTPWFANASLAMMSRTPQQARDEIKTFEDAGFDEFHFSAACTNAEQVDRLADAIL